MKLAPWVQAERARKHPRHAFEEAHDDPAPARLCWTCLWPRKNRIHQPSKRWNAPSRARSQGEAHEEAEVQVTQPGGLEIWFGGAILGVMSAVLIAAVFAKAKPTKKPRHK